MAKKKAATRVKGKDLIPADLLDFLTEHAGETFTFDRAKHPDMEVDTISFHLPAKLRQRTYTLNTWEYYHNYGEKGDDPEREYEIPGISLIADCGGSYDADGILVWFPSLGEYGYWDPDHGIIGLFPKVTWPTIVKKLPAYVNAGWNQTPKHTLLRPWADKRCAGITSKPG